MTEAQRQAHARMLATLPGQKVIDDEMLDDPKHWKPYNRDLSPSEQHHLDLLMDTRDTDREETGVVEVHQGLHGAARRVTGSSGKRWASNVIGSVERPRAKDGFRRGAVVEGERA